MAQTDSEIENQLHSCAVCQIPAEKKCTACNTVVYCTKEHQRKHWPVHKKDCKCWKVVEDPSGLKGRYELFVCRIICILGYLYSTTTIFYLAQS